MVFPPSKLSEAAALSRAVQKMPLQTALFFFRVSSFFHLRPSQPPEPLPLKLFLCWDVGYVIIIFSFFPGTDLPLNKLEKAATLRRAIQKTMPENVSTSLHPWAASRTAAILPLRVSWSKRVRSCCCDCSAQQCEVLTTPQKSLSDPSTVRTLYARGSRPKRSLTEVVPQGQSLNMGVL